MAANQQTANQQAANQPAFAATLARFQGALDFTDWVQLNIYTEREEALCWH